MEKGVPAVVLTHRDDEVQRVDGALTCLPRLRQKWRAMHIYERDLGQNAANFVQLSPLTFLERAASVYPGRTAIIHGPRRFTWAETGKRCRRLASALRARGIGKNDTVAALLANTPEMFEAHFGVPMAGAVLNAIN